MAAETTVVLKEAYNTESLGRLTISLWHKAFSLGQASVEIFPFSRQPARMQAKENVNAISVIAQEDGHLSCSKLAAMNKLHISKSSIH